MAFLPAVLILFLSGALAKDLQPPQIVKDKARIIELKTGSINRFVLECVAIAEPAPTYYWYRNGEKLDDLEGVVSYMMIQGVKFIPTLLSPLP